MSVAPPSLCQACEALVGASGNVSPHDQLTMLNFRKEVSIGARSDFVEFYRCAACRSILVRDLNSAHMDARWDWLH